MSVARTCESGELRRAALKKGLCVSYVLLVVRCEGFRQCGVKESVRKGSKCQLQDSMEYGAVVFRTLEDALVV